MARFDRSNYFSNSTMVEETLNIRFVQSFQIQKYLVVLTKWFPPEETKLLLDKIFSAAWVYGIIEISTLVYSTNASWSLITYLPYDTQDCMALTYRNLTTLTATNYTKFTDTPYAQLFLRKMRNMRKCTVNVVIYPCEPYVFESREKGRVYDGIEVRVIDAIALAMNFTPNYILPQDEYGNIWPNKGDSFHLKMVTSSADSSMKSMRLVENVTFYEIDKKNITFYSFPRRSSMGEQI